MMKNRMKNKMLQVALLSTLLVPQIAASSDAVLPELGSKLIIVADVSGSMQEEMSYLLESGEKQETTKVVLMKKILIRICRELPGNFCPIGIYRIRYLPGNRELASPFLDITLYGNDEIIEKISERFDTDYPVFNRRTPLADAFQSFDKNLFEKLGGTKKVLLISDGMESFYGMEKDKQEAKFTDGNSDEKVKGPLNEILRLKEKYADDFVLYTVFMGNRKKDGRRGKGESLLNLMADSSGGKSFAGAALYDNRSMLKELGALLCGKPPVIAAVAEKKQPPVVAEPEKKEVSDSDADADGVADHLDKCPGTKRGVAVNPAGCPPDEDNDGVADSSDKCPGTEKGISVDADGCPSDEDGDGVPDHEDRCLGTPAGVSPDASGCWIPGVKFATGKWDIDPDSFPELDRVVRILKQNPNLRVEIQGHTDNVGTTKKNQRLSENRAKSVMEYLTQKGIAQDRLAAKGYGEAQPAVSNATAEGRAINRRVELKPVQ